MSHELSKNLVFSDLILMPISESEVNLMRSFELLRTTSKLLIIALSLALNSDDLIGLILPF